MADVSENLLKKKPEIVIKDNSNNKENNDNQPKDKYNLVYCILILHGIGILIPWNVFINAQEYFVDHKLNTNLSESSEYRKNFVIYVGFAAQIPNLLLCAVNCFLQGNGMIREKVRFIAVMIIVIIVMVFTIILASVDTSSWPETFFALTIIAIIFSNCCTGVYQSLMFGLAANLPMKYSNAVILGSNLSGTVIALANICTKAATTTEVIDRNNIKNAAIIYFAIAVFILSVCFVTYFVMVRMPFFKFYLPSMETEIFDDDVVDLNGDKDEDESKGSSEVKDCFGICCFCPFSKGQKHCRAYWKDYLEAFKYCWVHCVSVFSLFLCTLTIFPGIHGQIKPINPDFFIPVKWYTDITCFLFFNLFALIGNVVSNWVRFPKPKYLFIPVWIRTVFFIPFFLLANFKLDQRIIPVVSNDYVQLIGVVVFAFTNGYFSSLCMMYSPRTPPKNLASHAGRITAFFLVLGLFCGVYGSFFLVKIATGSLGGSPYYSSQTNSTISNVTREL